MKFTDTEFVNSYWDSNPDVKYDTAPERRSQLMSYELIPQFNFLRIYPKNTQVLGPHLELLRGVLDSVTALHSRVLGSNHGRNSGLLDHFCLNKAFI